MRNFKNSRALAMMCAAAIGLFFVGCQTANTKNNLDSQTKTQVETNIQNKVSDQTFSGENLNEQKSASTNDEEELGTRTRRKQSKRGIASVEGK